MKLIYSSLFLIMISVIGCSSPEETVKPDDQKESKVYQSDEIKKIDSVKTETAKPVPSLLDKDNDVEKNRKSYPKFIVQVGAFTTRERAQSFVNESQVKLIQKLEISFSDKVHLYVVRLPEFNTREEADLVKNDLRKIPDFNDAFIITLEEQ
jgi:cell division septation protein DedD